MVHKILIEKMGDGIHIVLVLEDPGEIPDDLLIPFFLRKSVLSDAVTLRWLTALATNADPIDQQRFGIAWIM